LIKDFVPLVELEDLVFTGWEIFGGDLYTAAKTAQVLDRDQMDKIRPFLESIEPMPAVFDQQYVERLTARKAKTGRNKYDLAQQVREDIQNFKPKDRPPSHDLVRIDGNLSPGNRCSSNVEEL
jgi:myo-inositol-1-phosphate synthase